jgi:CO/xanthine dehydrogenase Mo-binding subunit/CO/xanthine dehydrogenase FAD-binding subunit
MTHKVVGQPIPMLDAVEKVTGRAIFTQDFQLPGMLFGAILRSPFAHARIQKIDVSKAAATPGVVAIVTGEDFEKKYLNFGPDYADRYPVARGVARFFGEEVAAVAAETREAAQQALRAIAVEYEELPAVLQPCDAMVSHAPEIHPAGKLPLNYAQITKADWGDFAAGIQAASHVVSDTYSNPVVAPVCMETNGVVASFDKDANTIEIWAGTQAPFFVRKEISHILSLPLHSVRVKSIFIGGGFGGKSQSPEPIAIAAMLSAKANRPVKIVLGRKEEFVAGKTDHAKSMTVTSAAAEDGHLIARHSDYVVDNGAFTHMGPAYVSAVRQRTANLYRVDRVGFTGRLIYTNKVPGGSYRGMGAPHIIWAIESQIDQLAEKLNKDPLEYRIQLANQPGDVTPQGFRISTCGLSECLSEAGRLIGWEARKRNPVPFRGVGFGAMINPSVGVLYPEGNFANVALELQADGTFRLFTQAADCGTAQNTVLAQFAAEEIGISIQQFQVVHMDTELAPDDLGSAASRVTFVTGAATIDAGKKIKLAVSDKLAAKWGIAPEKIVFEDGYVAEERNNTRRLTWRQVAGLIGPLRVEGRHEINLERSQPITGYGHYSATYGFGAQAAEVEVDPATGKIRVLKVVSVLDIGKVVNPLTLDGQMHGGIAQGIGMALSEELVFDHGIPVNTSLINYRVPRIFEAPEIVTHYIETNDKLGPLGAKAGGEHSINPTVAAIGNAVANAIGVRFTDLPITPQKVLDALRARNRAPVARQPWRRPLNLEVATVRKLYPKIVFPALKAAGKKLSKGRRKVSRFDFVTPTTIEEACRHLSRTDVKAKPVAGGTDLLVGIRQGIYDPDILVDISRLTEIRRIERTDSSIVIGASVTLSELCDSQLVHDELPGFSAGLGLIATQQIRNAATIAGDLCQEKRCWFFRSTLPCYKFGGASCPCYAVTGDSRHHSIIGAGRCAAPCIADAAPMLVALDASVHVFGPEGRRKIPMESFYLAPGETTLQRGELIFAIEVPLLNGAAFHYEKFAHWRGDFPEASAAVRLELNRKNAPAIRISFGGVSPLPMRPHATEAQLQKAGLGEENIERAARRAVHGALPLKDNEGKVEMLVAVTAAAVRKARNQFVSLS